MRKRVIALLPMKANSERIKGKNFRDFNGKPLFRWVLDTLLSVSDIDKIIINTDARSILADNGFVSSKRIEIRDRPEEICGDFVSMNQVIADDVCNVNSDIYLMTHTTNPLVSTTTISRAVNQFSEALEKGIADSLFSVDKIQTRFYREDCSPVNHNPSYLIRTQDLEPWYEENSNLYLFTRDSFRKTNARIGERPMMFETPKYESIDIDTPEDWDFALAIHQFFLDKIAKDLKLAS